MPLNETQIAALAAELQAPEYRDGQGHPLPTPALLARLTARPRVPNPSPALQRPAHVNALDLMAALSAESLAKLEQAHLIGEINAAIGRQDRPSILAWITYSQFRGHITTEEANACAALVTATADDPDWPAEVDAGPAPVQRLFGDEVGLSRHDVDQALGREDEE